tara:strand:+ start:632 stop:2584 length:1953 start_codon:yes stop_codon:yes gene_type:complete
MAKFIIEIRSKGFTNAKKRIDETTVALRQQALAARTTRGAMRKLNQAYKGINLAVSRFRNTVLLATFALTPFVFALRKLTEVTRAAELEDLTKGFTSLRVAAGLNEDTLEKLREATNGTVTDMELMRQANNAMLLGVARSTDELAEMFDIAQRLGRALGKDATSSLESFVTGLGRQSRLMLDNIGLMIKTNEAYEAFAKANQTTVSAMSDMEKKTAFINAGLEQGREKVAAFGEEIESSSDKIRSTNTAVQTFSDDLSIGFSGGFELLSERLGETAESLSVFIRAMLPATFATRELEAKAHALRMELAELKLKTDEQVTATRELTDEEKKLQKRQETRIKNLKFELLNREDMLGVEKEMLKVKLDMREAISSEEMALLNLLDTRSLALKIQGKEKEFIEAQIAIKERQAAMIEDEETESAIKRLQNMMEANDKLRELIIAFIDEQLQRISDFEDEKNRIHNMAAEELKQLQEELNEETSKKTKKTQQELEEQFRSTASAITTVSGALQVLVNRGASAEDKLKSLLTTIGALLMQSGGAGLPFGAALQAFAGFIGHTGGLIQNNGIQRFATGGMVQGQDNVPIMAQSGEFIMQRSAVNSIGLQNLAQMNNTGEPSGGVTINIAGDMIGDEDHVRTKVLPAIKEELRREANA